MIIVLPSECSCFLCRQKGTCACLDAPLGITGCKFLCRFGRCTRRLNVRTQMHLRIPCSKTAHSESKHMPHLQVCTPHAALALPSATWLSGQATARFWPAAAAPWYVPLVLFVTVSHPLPNEAHNTPLHSLASGASSARTSVRSATLRADTWATACATAGRCTCSPCVRS